MPDPENWTPLCRQLYESPNFWPVVAGIVVLLALLIVLARARRARKGVAIHESDTGDVRVSTKALQELVTSACNRVHLVRKPKVRFRTRGGRIHLLVKVRLQPGRRIADTYEEMKRGMTEALEETLGAERVGNVNLMVTGFEPAPKKTVSSIQPQYDTPASPAEAADDPVPSEDPEAPQDDDERRNDPPLR